MHATYILDEMDKYRKGQLFDKQAYITYSSLWISFKKGVTEFEMAELLNLSQKDVLHLLYKAPMLL